jgi:hypothetical protein
MRVPAELLIIDVDPRRDGLEDLGRLAQHYGPLPRTMISYSGRGDGGRHLWFYHPGGEVTGARLGRGIDLKTRAGYVLVPPSIHPATGAPYVWGVLGVPAELPLRYVELLRPSSRLLAVSTPTASGDEETVAPSGAALVASYKRRADAYGRNNALWWSFTRALKEGDQEAIDALKAAASHAGLSDREIDKQYAGARKATGL